MEDAYSVILVIGLIMILIFGFPFSGILLIIMCVAKVGLLVIDSNKESRKKKIQSKFKKNKTY